jgi:hypothetical protein
MRKPGENRGGPRPGAGRKPRYENSDRFVEELIAAEEASVARGEPSMAEVLLAVAKGGDKRSALTAMKLFFDKVVVPAQQHEQTVLTHHQGPALYLPEEQPDLAGVGNVVSMRPE